MSARSFPPADQHSLAPPQRSLIHNIGQIERGCEKIDERLRALGAQIERMP